MTQSVFEIERPTYIEARDEFRHMAKLCGAVLTSYPLADIRGKSGEELCIDVASIGPDDAELVFVIDIGMHGVESFGGLIALSCFLENICSFEILRTMRIIAIFPMNPYSVSWLRRVNGNNVDLSRNFREFPLGPDESLCHPDYDRLYDILNPQSINTLSCIRQRVVALQYIAEKSADEYRRQEKCFRIKKLSRCLKDGWRKLKHVVGSGQYKYARGVEFGGFEPELENRIMREIIQKEIPGSVKRLAWINDHVGLGPQDASTIITEFDNDAEEFGRCRRWYGNLQTIESSHDAYAVSTALPGMGAIEHAVNEEVGRIAPTCEITAFCLEVGVPFFLFGVPLPLPSLWQLGWITLEDNWLHHYGDLDSKIGIEIKNAMVRSFYPPDRSWREKCREEKLRILQQTIAGLARGA